MISARRTALKGAYSHAITSATSAPHPALLLHHGLATQDDPKERTALLRAVAASQPGDLYKAAFARWQAALASRSDVLTRTVHATSRLIVGLGGESVLEAGITLHHPYGTPVLPGSALKGLACHYAARHLHLDADTLNVLSGTTKAAGYITYFDAWFVPNGTRPLAQDVMTVHHPRYYMGSPRRAPWDFDDPNPVSFVVADGSFWLALAGPTPAWTEFALRVLLAALAEWGIGGKTSSGYGRMIADPSAQDVANGGAETAATPLLYPLVERVKALPANKIKPEMGGIAQLCLNLPEGPERTATRRAILDKIAADPRLLKDLRDKLWYVKLTSLDQE